MTELFGISVSFGSVNSPTSIIQRMSHASVPFELRASRSLPEDLLRISVGIEDPKDLIKDLGERLDAT
jgi:cysteine-S-conjugate beta-lyase